VDWIEVVGIRAFGHHGVLAHEREFGQEFTIDVRIGLDFGPAVHADDLHLTADYGHVAQVVVDLVTGPPSALIETLADRIAAAVAQLPAVQQVVVTVHKPHAPMPVGVADVTVTRRRGAPTTAFVALGSNLGDSVGSLNQAIADLTATPGITFGAKSNLYQTAAVGGPEQPDYLNAVVSLRTELSPHELLAACQTIEHLGGRQREEHWGPRTIDIDIVDMVGYRVAEPDLQIPHPRARMRGFVLVPWADIASDHRLGGVGPSVAALAAEVGTENVSRVESSDW